MKTHQFAAVAFEENLSLKELQPHYPGAKVTLREMRLALDGGEIFLYPFGAIVFHDVTPERRETELTLVVDTFPPPRAAVVALIVAQSAAMEYYERIVAQLFDRTSALVDRLEKRGTVTLLTRGLHRFIGQAIATRSEVITVLTLLDKPDATWDDPAMDRIYDDLRAEFDLIDRYGALEQKLRFVQDAMELVLDVARDRRMWLLEVAIFGLIIIEVALELWRRS